MLLFVPYHFLDYRSFVHNLLLSVKDIFVMYFPLKLCKERGSELATVRGHNCPSKENNTNVPYIINVKS